MKDIATKLATASTLTYCLYANGVKMDDETINITYDGAGSLKADFDNETIMVGTGSDNILDTAISNLSTTINLQYGGELCTDLTVTSVYFHRNGESQTAVTLTSSKQALSCEKNICMATAQTSTSAITFNFDLSGTTETLTGLNLAKVIYFNITVSGKTSGGDIKFGTGTFKIAGLQGGKEALYYELITSPTSIHVNGGAAANWSHNKIDISVRQVEGDKPTTIKDGKVYWQPKGRTD